MKRNRIAKFLSIAAVLIQTSCVKEIDKFDGMTPSSSTVNDMVDLQVPSNFRYSSENQYQLNLNLKCNDNSPMKGIVVRLVEDVENANATEIFRGCTDNNGNLNTTVQIKSAVQTIYLKTDYIGLINEYPIELNSSVININLGGSNPQRMKDNTNDNLRVFDPGNQQSKFQAVPTKDYLGTWNNLGVPNYKTSSRDVVPSDFLARINNSFPESQPVPTYNPQYIASGTESNVEITQAADVWMTFVHEGAGYKNTVGYYVYNKNTPPLTTNDLSSIKIVFPNFSYLNSGGGLVSGDKVHLGTFGPDTAIGFVLLANAYNSSNSTVGNGYGQYYSNPDLNPEPTATLRSHNVMLWDVPQQKMVIGFEDINRTGGDHDFNDALFYVSSNPVSAISRVDVLETTAPNDSDGDGISDNLDEYPNDPALAFNSYYPSRTSFSNISFEDLWPYRGDYDLNDMIIGYQINQVKNSSNEVKQIKTKLFLKAAGGSYINGYGFELPVSSSAVESVTGTDITHSYIVNNANGTEANQSKAVIIAFDDLNNIAARPSGYYINTEPGSPIVVPDTLNITVTFVTPVSLTSLGNAPYNPFMISNMRRGYEIHLADHPPTSLVDQSLFNKGNDRTNPVIGRYYKSDKNLPWAINIPSNEPIVIEKNQLVKGFLKFQDWCQSGGINFSDWYQNKNGYRDNANLLNR